MIPAAFAALLCAAALPAAAVSAGDHGSARVLRRAQQGQLATSSGSELSQGTTLQSLHPYYHSTEEIRAELARLSKKCPGFTLESVAGNSTSNRPGPVIDVVTVSAPGSRPVNRNFILFGEHSRELISPESGLFFVRALCGETSLAERARAALQNSEFQIVVNGNPDSRRKVEGGDFCLRTNPDGVDLNRNWDEEWQAAPSFDVGDTNPGPRPFSEPETQVFRELVEAYKPTTFLTVHSGTKGMYMPFAFDKEHLAKRNQPQMLSVLKSLDSKHCQCPFGAAGKEVGYDCPGTCLDWVYDRLQTPYSFAFEIYVGSGSDDSLKKRWEDKMAAAGASLLQESGHLAHEHFKDIFESHPSSFVQVRSNRTHSHLSATDCFGIFNPGDAKEYEAVIENWAGAFLDMADLVAANLKRPDGSASLDEGSP